jgi:hypothetical protein
LAHPSWLVRMPSERLSQLESAGDSVMPRCASCHLADLSRHGLSLVSGELEPPPPPELGASWVTGALQVLSHVLGPTSPSTLRPFSAWNWRHTFSLSGP